MKDAASVIAEATDGIGTELAQEYEVSTARMYEILGKDNPYPKAKVLIRKIGRRDRSADKHRVRLIKADMDAMFHEILGENPRVVTAADVHREAFQAIDAMLEDKPAAVQLKELRELIAVAQEKAAGIERLTERGELKAVV